MMWRKIAEDTLVIVIIAVFIAILYVIWSEPAIFGMN